MGYRPGTKRYKLVFAQDDPLHGLEITARPCTLGALRELQDKEDSATARVSIDADIDALVDHITEWNLEDELGGIAPITVDAIRELPLEEIRRILSAWFGKSTGTGAVDPPSPPVSPPGNGTGPEPRMEVSLPREPLPESPPS